MECADLGRYHRRENFQNPNLLKGKIYWNPCHWSKIYVIIGMILDAKHTEKELCQNHPSTTQLCMRLNYPAMAPLPPGKESKQRVSGYLSCVGHARRKPFLSSSINSTVLIPAVLTPPTVLMWGPPWLRGFPCGSAGKESACNVGDLGSIPWLGGSPEEGKGYPPQYSGLENSMDCIVHGVTKSWTWLSDFHFPFPWLGKGPSGKR